jgi:hypothetical protein
MNQKFITNRIINSLIVAGLLATSVQANAEGFHEGNNNHGIAISAIKFNEVLANTNTEQLGYNFGSPDEIQMLNGTDGERVGSVWVYHDAVQKDGSKQDAHFVIVNGKLQYATLSNAI